MAIAYYISSHGLGHVVRSCEVIRSLPADLPIHIKTGAPESFFREELSRPFEFHDAAFDCGAVHVDSLSIDRRGTLEAYRDVSERNKTRLKAEADWLQASGVTLVVSDVASFPLVVAKHAQIPSVVIANFTWVEIYRPYVKDYAEFAPLLSEMEAEYAQADLAIVTPLDVPMPAFRRTWRAPLIGRYGNAIRREIAECYGADPGKAWWLFYPGIFDLEFDWSALEECSGSLFFTFLAPKTKPANVVALERGRFRHVDVSASVDGVIAKPGYSMVCECMANGAPLLYTHRDDFCEFEVLDTALQEWGGALRIPQAQFRSADWGEALGRLRKLQPKPVDNMNGGAVIARKLSELASTNRR